MAAKGVELENLDVVYHKRVVWNCVMTVIICLCALIVVLPLIFIFGYLAKEGIQALNWDFLTKLPVPVGETGGGMANAIVGSLTLIGIASFVGIPIGIGVGIFLAEFRVTSLGHPIRFLVDSMNSIPSIVFGIAIYSLVVAPMKTFSALSGGVVLGVMMIPVIIKTTEGFLKLVPNSLREAALALGAPEWRVTCGVVLHAAAGGIMTGVVLAVARVMGETAPLLFTAFGNNNWNHGILHPIAALPLQIFIYAISPFPDWHRQAWAGALVLMVVILIVNIVTRLFVTYQTRHAVKL